MCIKINRKGAFFIQYSWTKKSKYCCHPPFHPPIFCRHSLKLLSPTLPKLMNWTPLSPPPLPLSSDPDNPQNLERAPGTYKAHHQFRIKSMENLPWNPQILKTLLKALVKQFMTAFRHCLILKQCLTLFSTGYFKNTTVWGPCLTSLFLVQS